jgi:hypothetical protein
MAATSTISFRKNAAAAVVAGAAVLASFGVAKGQQLAATDLDSDRQAQIVRQCGAIDRASLECVARSSIEFDRAQTAALKKQSEELRKQAAESRLAIEAAKKSIAKSDSIIAETQCASELAAGLRNNDPRFAPDRGKAILKGTPVREFGFCKLRDALTKS